MIPVPCPNTGEKEKQMKKHVEKQIINGKRYKDITSVKASTKKEEQVLALYKYNAIVSDKWNSWIDTSMLPYDDEVNLYLYPECVFRGGFDYNDQSSIPDNVTVFNAYKTVKDPVRAAKWRRRNNIVVRDIPLEDWGGKVVDHVVFFK